jgi:hypothetical protein
MIAWMRRRRSPYPPGAEVISRPAGPWVIVRYPERIVVRCPCGCQMRLDPGLSTTCDGCGARYAWRNGMLDITATLEIIEKAQRGWVNVAWREEPWPK